MGQPPDFVWLILFYITAPILAKSHSLHGFKASYETHLRISTVILFVNFINDMTVYSTRQKALDKHNFSLRREEQQSEI